MCENVYECIDDSFRAWLYGLARLAGLFRCAEITFSPVLHEVSQPGWWLMPWNAWYRWLIRWTRKTWCYDAFFFCLFDKSRSLPFCSAILKICTWEHVGRERPYKARAIFFTHSSRGHYYADRNRKTKSRIRKWQSYLKGCRKLLDLNLKKTWVLI